MNNITNKERLLEAARNHDYETVKECAEIAEHVFLNVNYSQANFFSSVLKFIGEKYGDDAVKEALMNVAEETWSKPYLELLPDRRKVIDFWINNYSCATFDYDVFEDDEKAIITIKECKTGGAIIKRGGSYGTTSVQEEWCFNRKNIPYYCCHCKINKEIIPREMGYDYSEFKCGLEVMKNGEYVIEPCHLIIHKSRKKEE